MAEAALFSIACKVLSSISSPAFEKAYERARSIWGATDELKELKQTILSIQSVLLDAEKQHNDSAKVKNWIGRVRDVLYDAEDLFDVIATDDLLKQRMKGKKPIRSVRVFFSKLNPIASRDFISKKVKAIRKDLHRISEDMALLGFVSCESEKFSVGGIGRGVETGSFVDPEDIIGRDDEKKQVIDFVYNEAYAERNVSLISIVGIGGMGKSTLAQLIYNDAKISGGFPCRYWACISDIFDEKEILGKINRSLTGQGKYQDLSLDSLQTSIRGSIDRNGRFLLVLDDLWDEDSGRWSKLWSILSSERANGSKVIVTTRHLSVAKAMRADETLQLKGLSRDASWTLFKRYAFTEDKENDQTWIRIGEKIAAKCSNVPLAIKSIGSLLRVKDTIEEWKSLENEELSKIELKDNSIMSTLRLSYDHLPSHLKNCFAYCSLYPKDYLLKKKDLIYCWIAQGYIAPKEGETLEMAGHACFMELFRRSFFQVAGYYQSEIRSCMMHDLLHDLAKDVAGEESCVIATPGKYQSHNKIRHLCISHDKLNEPPEIDTPMLFLNADRLRTVLYTAYSCNRQLLDEQVKQFRFLHVLGLSCQGIEDVPTSIGEMKYLRYLDLSNNEFTHLPDSITKLVNLITLDIGKCYNLVKLPRDVGDLVSLRHLVNYSCDKLRSMPPTIGKLTSLEQLSQFMVTKSGDMVSGEFCGLRALGRLKIRGSLTVSFDNGVEWDRDKVLIEHEQLPDSLEALSIEAYPSKRISAWWKDINLASRLPKLEHLFIGKSIHVKHLPPFRHLPCLTSLHLDSLCDLEFIEHDEAVSTTPFFPSLSTLRIMNMENLKGFSRETKAILMFPSLSKLYIQTCPLFSSVPFAPHLKSMYLSSTRAELFDQLVSRPCSSSIEKCGIHDCNGLRIFSGEGLTSLRSLTITYCGTLSKVKVAPNTVEEFTIVGCPNIELSWEQRKDQETSLDWTAFVNLRVLTLAREQQESTTLPDCVKHLILLGKLRVDYQRWNFAC